MGQSITFELDDDAFEGLKEVIIDQALQPDDFAGAVRFLLEETDFVQAVEEEEEEEEEEEDEDEESADESTKEAQPADAASAEPAVVTPREETVSLEVVDPQALAATPSDNV